MRTAVTVYACVYVWHSAILKLIQTHSYTRMDGSGTMFEMCDYATRADYESRKTEHTRVQPQLVGVLTGWGMQGLCGYLPNVFKFWMDIR